MSSEALGDDPVPTTFLRKLSRGSGSPLQHTGTPGNSGADETMPRDQGGEVGANSGEVHHCIMDEACEPPQHVSPSCSARRVGSGTRAKCCASEHFETFATVSHLSGYPNSRGGVPETQPDEDGRWQSPMIVVCPTQAATVLGDVSYAPRLTALMGKCEAEGGHADPPLNTRICGAEGRPESIAHEEVTRADASLSHTTFFMSFFRTFCVQSAHVPFSDYPRHSAQLDGPKEDGFFREVTRGGVDGWVPAAPLLATTERRRPLGPSAHIPAAAGSELPFCSGSSESSSSDEACATSLRADVAEGRPRKRKSSRGSKSTSGAASAKRVVRSRDQSDKDKSSASSSSSAVSDVAVGWINVGPSSPNHSDDCSDTSVGLVSGTIEVRGWHSSSTTTNSTEWLELCDGNKQAPQDRQQRLSVSMPPQRHLPQCSSWRERMYSSRLESNFSVVPAITPIERPSSRDPEATKEDARQSNCVALPPALSTTPSRWRHLTGDVNRLGRMSSQRDMVVPSGRSDGADTPIVFTTEDTHLWEHDSNIKGFLAIDYLAKRVASGYNVGVLCGDMSRVSFRASIAVLQLLCRRLYRLIETPQLGISGCHGVSSLMNGEASDLVDGAARRIDSSLCLSVVLVKHGMWKSVSVTSPGAEFEDLVVGESPLIGPGLVKAPFIKVNGPEDVQCILATVDTQLGADDRLHGVLLVSAVLKQVVSSLPAHEADVVVSAIQAVVARPAVYNKLLSIKDVPSSHLLQQLLRRPFLGRSFLHITPSASPDKVATSVSALQRIAISSTSPVISNGSVKRLAAFAEREAARLRALEHQRGGTHTAEGASGKLQSIVALLLQVKADAVQLLHSGCSGKVPMYCVSSTCPVTVAAMQETTHHTNSTSSGCAFHRAVALHPLPQWGAEVLLPCELDHFWIPTSLFPKVTTNRGVQFACTVSLVIFMDGPCASPPTATSSTLTQCPLPPAVEGLPVIPEIVIVADGRVGKAAASEGRGAHREGNNRRPYGGGLSDLPMTKQDDCPTSSSSAPVVSAKVREACAAFIEGKSVGFLCLAGSHVHVARDQMSDALFSSPCLEALRLAVRLVSSELLPREREDMMYGGAETSKAFTAKPLAVTLYASAVEVLSTDYAKDLLRDAPRARQSERSCARGCGSGDRGDADVAQAGSNLLELTPSWLPCGPIVHGARHVRVVSVGHFEDLLETARQRVDKATDEGTLLFFPLILVQRTTCTSFDGNSGDEPTTRDRSGSLIESDFYDTQLSCLFLVITNNATMLKDAYPSVQSTKVNDPRCFLRFPGRAEIVIAADMKHNDPDAATIAEMLKVLGGSCHIAVPDEAYCRSRSKPGSLREFSAFLSSKRCHTVASLLSKNCHSSITESPPPCRRILWMRSAVRDMLEGRGHPHAYGSNRLYDITQPPRLSCPCRSLCCNMSQETRNPLRSIHVRSYGGIDVEESPQKGSWGCCAAPTFSLLAQAGSCCSMGKADLPHVLIDCSPECSIADSDEEVDAVDLQMPQWVSVQPSELETSFVPAAVHFPYNSSEREWGAW